MPNQALKHDYFTVPDNIINYLRTSVARNKNKADEKGFKRANGIIENPKIKYNHMRRLKNYFDTYEGDGRDLEYELNGGNDMKNWVNNTLGTATDKIHHVKKVQMDIGKENAFIKTHTKDNNKNPTNVNLPENIEMNRIKELNEYLMKSTKNRL